MCTSLKGGGHCRVQLASRIVEAEGAAAHHGIRRRTPRESKMVQVNSCEVVPRAEASTAVSVVKRHVELRVLPERISINTKIKKKILAED